MPTEHCVIRITQYIKKKYKQLSISRSGTCD